MTTFKAFLHILNKVKVPIILYTVILLVFGTINFNSTSTSGTFTPTKPSILIINNDENIGITKNLVTYLASNNNISDIKTDSNSISDALFYRDVSYVITIPHNYRRDFLSGLNPTIEVQSTGDYSSSLTAMMLNRYLNIASLYQKTYHDENTIIDKINSTINSNTEVTITTHLDTTGLSKATSYYNFLSYSILAGAIYVICQILSSFHDDKIKKRTLISSSSYRKENRILLLSNCLLAAILWLFYLLISFILCGKVLLSLHGLIYIINSFVFTFTAVTIAFFISTIIKNKNALNGIINVVALGSSFLCGAFVPADLLPDFVLKIAHLLPTYWYINTNELVKEMEVFNLSSLKPIIINTFVVIIFGLIFIILSNVISKHQQKLDS